MGVIILTVLMILGAILCMIICLLSIKEEIAEGNIIMAALYAILLLCVLIALGRCAMAIRNEIVHHEDRYSAKEYRIETEIITRGGVSDTTYVITKK